MPKFKVYITGMAVVSQSQIIEADNAELARAEAVKPDTYNNGIWDYCGVKPDTIQCDEVEEVVLSYTDFDDQVDAALDEIERQLKADGVIN